MPVKKRTPEENARRAKIRELLEMSGITSMDDIQNLFKETIAEFMEDGLETEPDDELGEGHIVKKAVYIAIGIDLDGHKDVLSMWVGENES